METEPMPIEVARKRFTVEEYYRIAEAGVFAPDERLELIDGEIIQMSSMGTRHIGCVIRANQVLAAAFKERLIVSPQLPLRLGDHSEPEPDLALLVWRDDAYSTKIPSSEDAVLVLEISDSTLRYDREVKLPLYAESGIPEIWIADLTSDVLHVYREPSGNAYPVHHTHRRGERVSLAAFPDVVFDADDFLG